MLELIGYLLALLIGVSLGLIGSGGSILSIPILVYFFGVTPEVATTHSLFIVGLTAIVASYKHYKLGNLKVSTAILFSIPSIITLLLTRKYILPNIPDIILKTEAITLSKHHFMMGLFSILMMASSVFMIRNKNANSQTGVPSRSTLILIAIGVGFVTGLLGAGGGFLIVPALLLYAKLDVKSAIATSLTIITINCLIGFVGDLINDVQFNKMLLLKVSIMALLGMMAGIGLSKKMDGQKLKPVFGWFVLLMGLFILLREFMFS